jgi:hypothetical protein
LVIRVSSDPAERTSTSPPAFGVAEVEGVELAAAELEEEEELLQAASPMQAMDTNAATRAPRR